MDNRKQSSILKQKVRVPLQEVMLPDIPDDDTVTTTVTRSRRVSFGTNFIKEFIVGSAATTQCVSEYEHVLSSSDSSRSATASHIFEQSTFSAQENVRLSMEAQALNLSMNKSHTENASENRYEFEVDKKQLNVLKQSKNLGDLHLGPEKVVNKSEDLNRSNNPEKRTKCGKFSSTICFSADSPTADMEFTEGCINLAKSILDKKKKAITVFIQAKETKPEGNETFVFETSDAEMSITKCVERDGDGDSSQEKINKSMMDVDDFTDSDMEETDVGAPFLPSGKNFTEETDGGILEDAFRMGMDPDVEKCLFSPKKKLSDVLNFPGDDSMDENMSLDDSRIEFDLKNEGEHTYYPQSEGMEFTKCVVPQELIVEKNLETLAIHKEDSMNMSACEPVMMEETPCKKIPLNKSHISFVDSESSDDGDSMDVTGCLNVPSEPDVNKFSLPAEKEKNDSLDDLTESGKRDSVDSFVGGLFTGENINNKNDGDGDFEAEDLSEDPLATPLETSLDNKKSFEDSGMDLTEGISREISVENVDVCGDEFEEEKENRDPLLIIPEGMNSFRESPVRDDGEEEDNLNLSDREMDVSRGKGILDDISHVSIPEKVPVKVMSPMKLIPDDVSISTAEEDIDEGKMCITPEKLILDDDSHVSIPPPEKKTGDESPEKSFGTSLPEIPEKIVREEERSRILTSKEFPTTESPENPVERSRILENSVRESPEKSVREERFGILQISVLGDSEKSVSEEKSKILEKSRSESPEKFFMETRSPQKPETKTPQKPKTETPRKPETESCRKPERETPPKPETSRRPETKTPQKPEAESSQKPKRETPRKPETPRKRETPRRPETKTLQKPEAETPQKMDTETPQKMQTESPQKMETETPILQRSVLESPGKFPRSERPGILQKSLWEIPEKSLINEQRNTLHEINFESPEKLATENERSRISEESVLDNPEKSVREEHSRISIPEVLKVFPATPEKFERSAILTAEEKRNPEKIVESRFETPEKSIPEERNLISPNESLNMSLGLENLNVSPDKAKLTASFIDSNPQKTPPGKFDVSKEPEPKENRSALNPDFEKSVSQLNDSALERSGMDLDAEKVPEPKDNSRSLININSNTITLHNETPINDRTGVTFTVTPKNSTYVVPNHTYVLEEEEKKEGREREILQSSDKISAQKPENRTPAKETTEKLEGDPELAGTETLQKPETPRRIEMETPEKPETETSRTPETKTPQKQDTETPQKMETETPPKSENKTASNRSPRNAQRLQFPAKESVKRLSVELSPLPENQHKKHRLSSDFAETGIRLVTDVSFDEMDEVTLNEIEENKETTVTTTNVTTENHFHLPPPSVSPIPTPSPPPVDDEKMEIDTKSFTDFTIGDSKIMTSLTEQAKETNCLWKIRQLDNSNSWIFTFNILRSTAVLEFKIKPSNEADSYSLVSDCQISLTHDDKYLTDADLTVIEFGFFKLEKFFRDQRKIQNVRQISYFLDLFNSCSSKLNGYLKQILSILEGYPGSSLKNETLSFRLFSFPVLFSSDVIVDLKNLSRLSISFERHFGDLNENEIINIFDESMKCENPLVDFIISSTKYIIRLELELGRISKRDHIGLLPEYLKKL